jgi:hypothetical protein
MNAKAGRVDMKQLGIEINFIHNLENYLVKKISWIIFIDGIEGPS